MRKILAFAVLVLAFSGATASCIGDNSTPETGVVDRIMDNDTAYGLQLQDHLKSDKENLWHSRWVKHIDGCKVGSHYTIDASGNATCKK
jgi:hypothetical protein